MDDPLSLLAFAVWTLAAGMYPLGFMFGVCSACCEQGCRSDTCEGFDLEEAFSCRGLGDEICDYEYLGDGKFALGTADDSPQPGNPYYLTFPQKGCWVSGEGIAFGTRVTEMSNEILDMGVSEPPRGCCRYTYFSNAFQQTFTAILTEQECDDHFDNPFLPNTGGFISGKDNKTWDECLDCNGNAFLQRFFVVGRTYSGRTIVTVDPVPESAPAGCVRFCGPSGLCGPMPRHPNGDEFGVGPFGADIANNYGGFGAHNMRRMCIRWLCRCYEGTGKKNQIDPETEEPLFPDPYDWYTVESTTEVGGPVVFGGTLTEKLEAATSNYFGYEKFEHDWLFGDPNEWQAAEGDRFCIVYRFVFYGTSQKATQDRCNFPDDEAPPGTVTPKDVWTVSACDRCSCQ